MELFAEIAFLFDAVYIPRRVREEFDKEPKSRKMLATILSEQAVYKRCNKADEVSVEVLLDELAGSREGSREHEGEAEAIVQAAQIGASSVIVDEKLARKWARSRGLECRGTLWILGQLRERALIPAIRPKIDVLIRHAIWLPKNEVAALLASFGET